MRKLCKMELMKLISENKLVVPDETEDSIHRIERSIDSIIEQKTRSDRLSSVFGHYEKVSE